MGTATDDAQLRNICEQLSKEDDPAKLTVLVKQLNCALDVFSNKRLPGKQPSGSVALSGQARHAANR
jgi:hypothetical protein